MKNFKKPILFTSFFILSIFIFFSLYSYANTGRKNTYSPDDAFLYAIRHKVNKYSVIDNRTGALLVPSDTTLNDPILKKVLPTSDDLNRLDNLNENITDNILTKPDFTETSPLYQLYVDPIYGKLRVNILLSYSVNIPKVQQTYQKIEEVCQNNCIIEQHVPSFAGLKISPLSGFNDNNMVPDQKLKPIQIGKGFMPSAHVSCTIGWWLRSQVEHKNLMVTAGHCLSNSHGGKENVPGCHLGKISCTFRVNKMGSSDWSTIEFNPGIYRPTTQVLFGNKIKKISGVGVPLIGDRIYKQGITTGTTSGKIFAVDATAIFMEENRMNIKKHMVLSDNNVWHGDSGGPVYRLSINDHVYALGISTIFTPDYRIGGGNSDAHALGFTDIRDILNESKTLLVKSTD